MDVRARLQSFGLADCNRVIRFGREDVGEALQFGVDAARRFELEATGARSRNRLAGDAVAYQQVTGPPRLVGGLCDRQVAFLPLSCVVVRKARGVTICIAL
jgi:hypothetical protein